MGTIIIFIIIGIIFCLNEQFPIFSSLLIGIFLGGILGLIAAFICGGIICEVSDCFSTEKEEMIYSVPYEQSAILLTGDEDIRFIIKEETGKGVLLINPSHITIEKTTKQPYVEIIKKDYPYKWMNKMFINPTSETYIIYLNSGVDNP